MLNNKSVAANKVQPRLDIKPTDTDLGLKPDRGVLPPIENRTRPATPTPPTPKEK